MHIVSIIGTPRHGGNSGILAQLVTDSAQEKGASVTTYRLNDLRFRGCQACSACKGQSEKCVLKDDLSQVLDDVIGCDVLILATPVFWGDISGQMKLFMDRTYSFLKPDFKTRPDKHRLPPGKKLVWIQVQGAEDERLFEDIFRRYNGFFRQLNYFKETHLLRGCGLSPADTVLDRSELIEKAKEIGKMVVEE